MLGKSIWNSIFQSIFLHCIRIWSTESFTAARASNLSHPFARRKSYFVSACRMCAITANWIACLSKDLAAAERPTRPLYFRQACSAMLNSLPGGHPGKRLRTCRANRSIYCWSSSARRAAARSTRRALTSLSARHSCSACSKVPWLRQEDLVFHIVFGRGSTLRPLPIRLNVFVHVASAQHHLPAKIQDDQGRHMIDRALLCLLRE